MRRRNPLAQWILATVSLAFAKGLGRMPLSISRRIARRLAHIAYYAVPRIRRVGLANLDLAYGDTLTHAEKTQILKQAVENVGLVAAEFTCIGQLRGAFLSQHVTVSGAEYLDRDRGGIVIGAHLGNWEWMAPAMAAFGYPAAEIVRPLDNPRLNAFVDGVRRSGAVQTIPKTGAWHTIVRALKEGCLVGVLVDQSPRDNGAPAHFFGQPCWATVAPVLMARRARVPVYPVSMTRAEDGHYSLEFGPAIAMTHSGDTVQDLVDNTQRCQDAIEAFVRKTPGQWLWLHRRWKPRPRLEREWKERSRSEV